MSPRDRKYQFFETPPHYIAALLSEVNIFGRVYEPCVGEGAISEALRKVPAVRRVHTNDIDKKRKADTALDACLSRTWIDFTVHGPGTPDWAVTNPPFSDELPILIEALDHAKNVAFLARLSFLEPTEDREGFLGENPPNQIIVLPRYSFRLNDDGKRQTDSVTCCWLVWYADQQIRGIQSWGRARAQAFATIAGIA